MIPLRDLIRRALRSVARPDRVLEGLPSDARINYLMVLSLMMLWGLPYALLHFHAMEGIWLFGRNWPPGVLAGRLLSFVLGSLTNWLLATVGLAAISAWRRWPVSLRQCEVAAFCLWVVWALMPLVDQLHLLGIPRRTLILPLPWGPRVAFIGHVAWLFAFPLVFAQLVAVLRRGMRFSWVASLAGSLLLLVLARGVMEMLVMRTQARLLQHGWHVNAWVLSAAHAALGLAQWGSIRLWLGGERRWPVLGVGSAAAVGGWVLLLW